MFAYFNCRYVLFLTALKKETMPRFHSLKVQEVRRETPDCVSVSLEVPEDLKEDFSFTQGQYLTFKTKIGDQDVRRSYSICRSPLDEDLRVAVKKVEGGLFSTYANEVLKTGDVLEVMKPMGRFFTQLNPENEKSYLAIAAGSGITPIMSIMKTVLLTEPNSEFTLIYGNKATNSIIFREEIEDLKNQYLNRLRVFYVLSREQTEIPFLYGRIDEDKCNSLFETIIDPSNVDEAFLCGPAPMIDASRQALEQAGMDAKNVHFELFASPQQLAEQKQATSDKKKGEGMQADVTIILDGLSTELTMDAEAENILDAALANGADLPFACKGGVCATCRAKIEEGEVEMDINYALEPDELERGFVLTCQAHPKTSKVVVNFDEA